jgi:hypothetical protein
MIWCLLSLRINSLVPELILQVHYIFVLSQWLVLKLSSFLLHETEIAAEDLVLIIQDVFDDCSVG